MTTIKTDSTPYIHTLTKERYLARHIALGKIGDAKNWTECVLYQKASAPSEWFCRSMAEFQAKFVEERELRIVQACTDLEIDPSHLMRASMEMWSFSETQNRITGDVTTHSHGHPAQDVTTGEVLYLDRRNGFAITDSVIILLEGEEVTLG
jgi:hypothetical protein